MTAPENISSHNEEGRCEVCGGTPPPGHRFCDNCWPEAAIAAGKAARCALCNVPKVIEKLRPQYGDSGPLVCSSHFPD